MRAVACAGLLALAAAAAAQPASPPALAYALPGGEPSAPPATVPSPRDASRPPRARVSDGALHAGVSGLLTLSGQYLLTDKAGLDARQALPVAAGVALALGLGKELADARRPARPEFSWPDLVADAFGVAVGVAIAGW